MIKPKTSALFLEGSSIGLIQLSPASLRSSKDNMLKGSWMLAPYCLGGGEASFVTFFKMQLLKMSMY